MLYFFRLSRYMVQHTSNFLKKGSKINLHTCLNRYRVETKGVARGRAQGARASPIEMLFQVFKLNFS